MLGPFNAPKAAALRVIGLGLLAAIVLEALHRRPQRSRRALAMDVAVVIWVAISILSTVNSVSPRLSLLGEIEQREGVLTTLALAGLYVGARRSHRTPEDARHTLDVVLGCAALAAVYALIQFAGFDPLAWSNTNTYPSRAGDLLRPFGTLGNPILLGALLAPALGIAVARVASGRGDSWRLAPLIALLAVAIVATLSRGAWLAAAFAVCAALAGALLFGGRRAVRTAGYALALATIPAALWGAFALRAPLVARISESWRPEAVSVPARAEIAHSALALWRLHPWLGSGPDTFGLMFPTVQTAIFWSNRWHGTPVQAHSAVLQILATLGAMGIVAGLVWLAAIVMAAASAWRQRDAETADRLDAPVGIAALAVAAAVNPIGLAGAALFVVLSALMVRGEVDANGSGSPSTRTPGSAWLAGLVVGGVVAVASAREMSALAAAGQAHGALYRIVVTNEANRALILEHAVQRSAEAVRRAPKEDELWRLDCDASLARARDALERGDTIAAASAATIGEASARNALTLEPNRAANLQRLGNALALRAQGGGFIADRVDSVFAEARRLAPFDALILVDEARAQLDQQRPERALATAQRIVAFYPEAATGHAMEAAARMMLRQPDDARTALRRALAARWEYGAESERRAAESLSRTLDAQDTVSRAR